MPGFRATLSLFYPPKPSFTEYNLPDLTGKIYIVTGSNTGLGKIISQLLYGKNAKVYIAARSAEKAQKAIQDIKNATPTSAGQLEFLHLDLADLPTIKKAAEEFLSKENKLHVLFNNAGVYAAPRDAKTVQGYPLNLGVHNIGHALLTSLLTPILIETARNEPPGTVRVVWVGSYGTEMVKNKSGVVDLDILTHHDDVAPLMRYNATKTGSYLQAAEFAKRHKGDNIVSVALNPGNLYTDLGRNLGKFTVLLLRLLFVYPPILGAYTQIFAGLSPEVTLEKTGSWIVPWGRFMDIRPDIFAATKSEAEGGSGIGEKFWEWNEEQIKPFV